MTYMDAVDQVVPAYPAPYWLSRLWQVSVTGWEACYGPAEAATIALFWATDKETYACTSPKL